MQGRRGLVVGVANHRSIAHGIARHAREAGAELALTYQSDRLESRVREIADDLGTDFVMPCDVCDDEQIAAVKDSVEQRWGKLDFLVHAVAFAERDDLEGRFADTSREGFAKALDVSAYSLVALTRALEPLLKAGGSVVTLSYLGSQRVVPHYNVMGVAKAALEACVRYLAVDLGPSGIRVNAISAGPIKTLSASGVKGLRTMLEHVKDTAPLQRNVDIDDVGRVAAFLLGEGSGAMTGEILYVDGGYHLHGAPGL